MRDLTELNEELEEAKRRLDIAQDNCAGTYRDYQEIPCKTNLQRMRDAKERYSEAEAAYTVLMDEFEEAWQRECGEDQWPQAV